MRKEFYLLEFYRVLLEIGIYYKDNEDKVIDFEDLLNAMYEKWGDLPQKDREKIATAYMNLSYCIYKEKTDAEILSEADE